MPVTLTDAVEQLVRSGAPILFSDTCSALDLIRLPLRAKSKTIGTLEIEAAVRLLVAVRDNEVSIILPPTVGREFARRDQQVIRETQAHLNTLQKNIEICNNIQDALFGRKDRLNLDFDLDPLIDLTKNLFDFGLELDIDSDAKSLAADRNMRREAPARLGGTIDDCNNVEHALALIKESRARGFASRAVYLTSNKKDYGEVTLEKPLDGEFAAVNLSYALSWQMARNQLGL